MGILLWTPWPILTFRILQMGKSMGKAWTGYQLNHSPLKRYLTGPEQNIGSSSPSRESMTTDQGYVKLQWCSCTVCVYGPKSLNKPERMDLSIYYTGPVQFHWCKE